MFDSRRSFSLEYDLIRSPAYLKSLELLLARLHVQRAFLISSVAIKSGP